MWTQAGWYGGARHDAISAAHEITARRTRVHTIKATGAQNVNLPPATKLRVGFPLYLVVCDTGSADIALRDAAGGAIVTLSAGERALLGLFDNSTAAGSWTHVKA